MGQQRCDGLQLVAVNRPAATRRGGEEERRRRWTTTMDDDNDFECLRGLRRARVTVAASHACGGATHCGMEATGRAAAVLLLECGVRRSLQWRERSCVDGESETDRQTASVLSCVRRRGRACTTEQSAEALAAVGASRADGSCVDVMPNARGAAETPRRYRWGSRRTDRGEPDARRSLPCRAACASGASLDSIERLVSSCAGSWLRMCAMVEKLLF